MHCTHSQEINMVQNQRNILGMYAIDIILLILIYLLLFDTITADLYCC